MSQRATIEDLLPYMPRRDVEELLGAIRDRLAHAAVKAETCRASFTVTTDAGLYAGVEWDSGLPHGRGRRAWGQPGHDRSS